MRVADVWASGEPYEAYVSPLVAVEFVGRLHVAGYGAFDAVVGGLGLDFVPRTADATSEVARVARTGGTVAAPAVDRCDALLASRLPVAGDCSIALSARAWAVRGRVDAARR